MLAWLEAASEQWQCSHEQMSIHTHLLRNCKRRWPQTNRVKSNTCSLDSRLHLSNGIAHTTNNIIFTHLLKSAIVIYVRQTLKNKTLIYTRLVPGRASPVHDSGLSIQGKGQRQRQGQRIIVDDSELAPVEIHWCIHSTEFIDYCRTFILEKLVPMKNILEELAPMKMSAPGGKGR